MVLKWLRAYRKEGDEQRGVWKDVARSNFLENEKLAAGKERDRYRRPHDRSSGVSWMAA